MISLAEAQTRIFALRPALATIDVPLNNAMGCWAAKDICALRTQPARNVSAMDGYAIRFTDGNGPWRVIGESAAGKRFSEKLGPKQAVRIFTGAVLPDGADTIVIQENTQLNGDNLTLIAEVPKAIGQHVRNAGGDFEQDQRLVTSGAKLTGPALALAAMGGHSQITVRHRPHIALLSTGDELVVPGRPCADDQIPSSNGIMLNAMLAEQPVTVQDYGIVRDDLNSLIEIFNQMQSADIIVTTGGASVGDYDLIIPALKAAGGTVDFWKIAMRPGKPVIVGQLGEAIVLGLPGNPVSAYVTAKLLLIPLIAHLGGAANPLPLRLTAQMGSDLPQNGPRMDHLRARLVKGKLLPVGVNDSSMLAALWQSNALIIRDINAAEVRAGEQVEYYPLP
jgi:molybdopterin molybdotransferase